MSARITEAKIAALKRAATALLDCEEMQLSYQESPRAHEARADLYATLRAADACRALKDRRTA